MTISTEHNPGKYDELCTYVRKQAQAAGTILIVFGGKSGAGFSVQAPKELIATIPHVLETMAAQIRKDLES